MNYQIDIKQMKKKTEIENNLLEQINSELKSCKDELKNIYQSKQIYSIFKIDENNNLKLDDLTNIFKKQNINNVVQNKLVEKLFAHVEQTYYAFQYFYLKKKDFMGMNLTGLIDGKMETGLGFRKCLEKIPNSTIKSKYSELENYYQIDNCDIWKVKSDKFGWNDYGLQLYKNFYVIVTNDDINGFNLLVEK